MKLLIFLLLPLFTTACNDASTTKSGAVNPAVEETTASDQQASGIQVISAEEYKKAISSGKVQLVDVRTPEEYSSGHIDKAVNINYYDPEFKKQIAKLDKSKPVYIYCRSGSRSQGAAKIMQELGFTSIIDLRGGYMNYR
jgi:rhodanese-related sulfurtransferase